MSEGLGYVIEVGGAAAGLVVKEANRFRFFAAEKRFFGLERKLYRSPADAENACRKLDQAAHRAASKAAAKQRAGRDHVPFGWPVVAV